MMPSTLIHFPTGGPPASNWVAKLRDTTTTGWLLSRSLSSIPRPATSRVPITAK